MVFKSSRLGFCVRDMDMGLLYRDLRDKVYYTLIIHAILLFFGIAIIFRCLLLPADTGYASTFRQFTTTRD